MPNDMLPSNFANDLQANQVLTPIYDVLTSIGLTVQ